jgi:hypothetical protein
MIEMTVEQRDTVVRKWERLLSSDNEQRPPSLYEFMATVEPTFGCDGAVVVPWCGMVLCIERDGYSHS